MFSRHTGQVAPHWWRCTHAGTLARTQQKLRRTNCRKLLERAQLPRWIVASHAVVAMVSDASTMSFHGNLGQAGFPAPLVRISVVGALMLVSDRCIWRTVHPWTQMWPSKSSTWTRGPSTW